MPELSERSSISSTERLQLIGLVTLAQQHNGALKEIERAMLEITKELERGSKKRIRVWDGGLTGDACLSFDPPVSLINDLLSALGITTDEPLPPEAESAND